MVFRLGHPRPDPALFGLWEELQQEIQGHGSVEEIQKDREAHGKKSLKEAETVSDDNDEQEPPKPSGSGKQNKNTSKKKQTRRKKEKRVKVSSSDPDSGWFRKGEHKNVFAYNVQTACDANGVILGYSVHPGNENDGRTFPAVLEKLEDLSVELVVGDTAHLCRGTAYGRFLLSDYAWHLVKSTKIFSPTKKVKGTKKVCSCFSADSCYNCERNGNAKPLAAPGGLRLRRSAHQKKRSDA